MTTSRQAIGGGRGRAKRRAALIAAAVGCAALAAPLGAANADATLPSKLDGAVLSGPSPRAIVLFDHKVTAGTIARLARAGITHARVFDAVDGVAVLGPAAAYVRIARWEDVSRVEDDTPIEFFNNVAKKDTGVNRVREGASPLSNRYTGAGVTVAVVDSGVDTTHPDLSSQVAVNVNMEPAAEMDAITGGDYSESQAETPIGTDEFGHGTHVAGTVGGTGEAAMGADLSGVAPAATLINCKIGLSNSFETSALACFQWLLDHRKDPRFPGGVRVATNSWGLSTPEDAQGVLPLEAMIRKMVAEDIAVVFAAGNSGRPEGDSPSTVSSYPNTMEEVITVAATCKSEGSNPDECDPGEVAGFSSRGPEIDLAAPGVDIWSTRATVSVLHPLGVASGSSQIPGGSDPIARVNNRALYMGISGTSMATPHVAGIVALMLEADPRLTPRKIEAILIATARDLGVTGFDVDYGHGFVDAAAAVLTAER